MALEFATLMAFIMATETHNYAQFGMESTNAQVGMQCSSARQKEHAR
jgi:hypothetical protein